MAKLFAPFELRFSHKTCRFIPSKLLLMLTALMLYFLRIQAANMKEFFAFEANVAGPSSASLIQASNSILYGTTVTGGLYDQGTIFQISTNGSLIVIASFDGTNGAKPYANLIQGSDGLFYGTTSAGGKYNLGTIFSMDSNSQISNLASFDNTNGATPYAGLLEVDGSFYGTAYSGGGSNLGTAFCYSSAGGLTALLSFNGTNGSRPKSGLVKGADGFLYGTASAGGHFNYGTIFGIQNDGTLSSLFLFDNTNGYNPCASLLYASDGSFYGTCKNGGDKGYGTIFRLNSNGVISRVVSFNNSNGSFPLAGLVETSPGIFYGTTSEGGTYGGSSDNSGTIFKVNSAGALTSYSFASSDGRNPRAGLVRASDNNLYGTTYVANYSSSGMVCRFRTNGVFNLLANFTSTNGSGPVDDIIQADDGCLYGTTYAGGVFGRGIFYRLTTNGYFTNLASFLGGPAISLISESSNIFYGMSSYGTIYKITSDGKITNLASVSVSIEPNAELTIGPDNALYGTTRAGGSAYYYGSIFRVTTNGALTTIYSFGTTNANSWPDFGVTLGQDGYLYGTTVGTVYRCSTNGIFSTILTIKSNSIYQGAPYFSGLSIGPEGTMYAMTSYGGYLAQGAGSGYGTVVQILKNGSYTPLLLFNGTNGINMSSVKAPIIGSDGALYGITPKGGSGYNGTSSSGKGVAFRLTTNGICTPMFLCDAGNRVSGSFSLTGDGQLYCVGSKSGNGGTGGSIFRLGLENEMLPVNRTADGLLISFTGLPGSTYRLLRSTNLLGPWEDLMTINSDSNDFLQYTDAAPQTAEAFYKTVSP